MSSRSEEPEKGNGTEECRTVVSVVTPFHNSVQFLERCIESVLKQSYSDFEYLLYDNASDDGSTEIALRFERIDARVRVIRSDELVDQVNNYNRALRCISGQARYVKVVQADDWLFEGCLASMVALGELHPKVGLISSFSLEEQWVRGQGVRYEKAVMDGGDAARLHLRGEAFLFGSPSTVLYRRDAVAAREYFYMPDRFQEDTELCYEILRDWDFGFVHQVLSFSRFEDDSTFGRLLRNDSVALSRVVVVHRYGSQFLSVTEAQALLERTLRMYYRVLGAAALRGKGRTYWGFHRENLAKEGIALCEWRVLVNALREIMLKVLCPREVLGWFVAKSRR